MEQHCALLRNSTDVTRSFQKCRTKHCSDHHSFLPANGGTAKSRILQSVLANATASHHRHTEKNSPVIFCYSSNPQSYIPAGLFAETAGDFVIKYHKTFISAESASAQSSAISALAQSIRSLYNYSNEQGRTLKPPSEATDTHKPVTLY